ncbi:hypothetical protein L6164_006980 [Bauhinia variegata]|uniref:Uncharacterized protein n=1 Tax=Bauhinia variegata TaxID=167791 RepID=A0ACB9PXY5_BAUVA|nr:hypothetical protein L6164_006980 [Bauhinia variegata]
MSVAASIPCIKIPTSSSSCCTSSSSTSSYSFRFSSSKPYYSIAIRNSQTEGPIRRPVAPPMREPSTAPQPVKPTPPSQIPPSPAPSAGPPPPPQRAAALVEDDKNVITLEFQRQKAKELQEYFKQKKLDEANQAPFFGFIGKNEINNGRWAMFGFAVGLLTEYATGSDFVDQLKILLSNFGIVDLE